jgi:ABC-type glycerol-3-phosphate transport system substrate-binding protein
VRRIWTLLIAVALISGCSGATPTAPPTVTAGATTVPATTAPSPTTVPVTTAPTPTAVAEPVKIVVWASHGGVYEKTMTKVADTFSQSHPGVTVEVDSVDNATFLTRLLTASASRTGPDITYWNDQFATTVLAKDIFAPLPEGMFDDYFAQVAPAWRTAYLDSSGNRVGIPYFGGPWGIDYRLDFMHDAGITDFPTTWSGLIDFCQKTVVKDAAGKITREGINFLPVWPMMPNTLDGLMATQGKRYLGLDGSVNLDSPEALAALQLIHDLIWKYECSLPQSKQPAPPAGSLGITAGLAAAQTLWPGSGAFWIGVEATDPNLLGKWDKATLFPKPDAGGVDADIIVADGWSVLKTSQHKDEAFAYLQALTSPDVMQEAFKFHPVVLNNIMTSQTVKDYYAQNAPGAVHALDFWTNPVASDGAQTAIRTVVAPKIQAIVTDGMVAALEDPNADLQSVLKKMQEDVQAALAP